MVAFAALADHVRQPLWQKSEFGASGGTGVPVVALRARGKAVQTDRKERTDEEKKVYEALLAEETLRHLDRTVDIHYGHYEPLFERYGSIVEECAGHLTTLAGGVMAEAASELLDRLALIRENVATVHDGGQMENTVREGAYEELRLRFAALADRALRAAAMASAVHKSGLKR